MKVLFSSENNGVAQNIFFVSISSTFKESAKQETIIIVLYSFVPTTHIIQRKILSNMAACNPLFRNKRFALNLLLSRNASKFAIFYV